MKDQILGLRPRLKSFAPLVLRSAAPKARHMIAWAVNPRLTMLSAVRSEGPRERVAKASSQIQHTHTDSTLRAIVFD